MYSGWAALFPGFSKGGLGTQEPLEPFKEPYGP